MSNVGWWWWWWRQIPFHSFHFFKVRWWNTWLIIVFLKRSQYFTLKPAIIQLHVFSNFRLPNTCTWPTAHFITAPDCTDPASVIYRRLYSPVVTLLITLCFVLLWRNDAEKLDWWIRDEFFGFLLDLCKTRRAVTKIRNLQSVLYGT